jgi:hypothetical protein
LIAGALKCYALVGREQLAERSAERRKNAAALLVIRSVELDS